ncbi:MAG TPA: hypothetical protein PKD55_07010 [Bellilinea sp.]|nr:hypothetical protein [Bellilinea sp.]
MEQKTGLVRNPQPVKIQTQIESGAECDSPPQFLSRVSPPQTVQASIIVQSQAYCKGIPLFSKREKSKGL